jgi:hypothetical protein
MPVPDGIIAQKERNQIGSITSGERSTMVTVCLSVSGTGRPFHQTLSFHGNIIFN